MNENNIKDEWFWFTPEKKKNIKINMPSLHMMDENKIMLFHCTDNTPQISYFNTKKAEYEDNIVLKKHEKIKKNEFNPEFIHNKTYLIDKNLFILKYTVNNDFSPIFMVSIEKNLICPVFTISRINTFRFSSCLINNNIYLFGGFTIDGVLKNEWYRFNLISLIFYKIDIEGKLPSPRHSSFLKKFNNNIFWIGGNLSTDSLDVNSKDYIFDIWFLNINEKIWIKLEYKQEIWPQIKSITEDEKRIYILNGKENLSNVLIIDCNSNWQINMKIEDNSLKIRSFQNCIFDPYNEIIWIFGYVKNNIERSNKMYSILLLKYTKNIDKIILKNYLKLKIKNDKSIKINNQTEEKDDMLPFEDYLRKEKLIS